MANHVSALKRTRTTEVKTAVNKMRKSRLRGQIKSLRKLVDEKNLEEAKNALPEVYSIIDRAAKWGVIKKNAAARYKSRLTAGVKRLEAPAA